MNNPNNRESKQLIIDSLLSIPGMLRASDLELKPHREEAHAASVDISLRKGRLAFGRRSANDDIYLDTPSSRIERVKSLIRRPLASTVLARALETEALKDCIANRQEAPGRSWAAAICQATRKVIVGRGVLAAEADLVKLGVILASLQQLVNSSNLGEDKDWVYRESKGARAYLAEHDPEAGLWLQYVLGHGPSVEEMSDKAKHLQSLVWQASRSVGTND